MPSCAGFAACSLSRCGIVSGSACCWHAIGFGIKPLFYAEFNGGRIAFASELTALACAPWISRDLDPDAVEAFLTFNSIPAPLTAYRGGAQARAQGICSTGARDDPPRALLATRARAGRRRAHRAGARSRT